MDTDRVSFVRCSKNLATADAPSLNDAVKTADLDSPLIALIGSGVLESRIPTQPIQARFRKPSDLAVLCVDGQKSTDVKLPPEMAPFLPTVAPILAIIFRPNVGLGEFLDLRGSVRAWLIHAVEQGLPQQRLAAETPATSDIVHDRLPKLRPAENSAEWGWLRERIERIAPQKLLPEIRSAADATAFQAGLLQVNDFLDASHVLAQSIEGGGRNHAADYWHAVHHRREPDDANAKYWFRRVGEHPLFAELASQSELLLDEFPHAANRWRQRLLPNGRWDPCAFVDLCQACPPTESDELSRFARRLQWMEMQLLLEQTQRDALGD